MNRRGWGCRKGSDRSVKRSMFFGRPVTNTLFGENVPFSFFSFVFLYGKNGGGLGADACVDFLEDGTKRVGSRCEGSFVCFYIVSRRIPSFGDHFVVERRIEEWRFRSRLTLVRYCLYDLSVQSVFVGLCLGFADGL